LRLSAGKWSAKFKSGCSVSIRPKIYPAMHKNIRSI
jgi:hypothetical protein